MDGLLKERRTKTSERIQSLQHDLTIAEGLCRNKACVYATGSFGRGEATDHSDLDLFIVGQTVPNATAGKKSLLRPLDEILLKADLIETTRKFGIRDFDGEGAYLVHYTVDELIKTIGKAEDDANNTFTARLLLLLESFPLLETSVYEDIIGEVLSAYWSDYEDHKSDFTPAFLANDILRLWRTFCVNYEANTAREPLEKRAKRKLKNYKLKHSRLLTCYSALLYLLGCYAQRNTVRPTDASAMVALSPTQRLEWILGEDALNAAHGKVGELLESYSLFLQGTDASESTMIERFLDTNVKEKYFAAAHQLGDLVFDLLQLIGQGSSFHRLLVV